MSISISVDTTIIATVVSAIISVAILLVSNYFIQPRKLKHNWLVENLEKRLEVYGALITLIDSMQTKTERQPINLPEESKNFTYQMENPFDYNRLLAILEKKNYLFSKEITQLWLKVLKDDKYFSIYESTKGGHGLELADFKDMQGRAKKEYSELKTQYEKLTGIKLPN
jgi:hypothetical protein